MTLFPMLSLLPILLLFMSKYLSRKIGKLLLIIAVLMGFFWGAYGLWFNITTPSNDGLGWIGVTGVIYCILIILTSLNISKNKHRLLNNL